MTNALEVKTKKTYDSRGHEGVCTYQRMSEWFNGEGRYTEYWATVHCSDTSTGHGWGGQMSKTEWENL